MKTYCYDVKVLDSVVELLNKRIQKDSPELLRGALDPFIAQMIFTVNGVTVVVEGRPGVNKQEFPNDTILVREFSFDELRDL